MPTRPRPLLRLGLAGPVFAVLALALAVPTVIAADRDVAIRDFAFSPPSVEIRVGDSVTWANRDSVAHGATARNGSFDTGLLEEGQSGSIRFTVAGTYRYLCTPHPDMTGTVIVRPASGGVRPPNTDMAALTVISDASVASDSSTLAGLAAVGGLAFLIAWRTIRRRRENRLTGRGRSRGQRR